MSKPQVAHYYGDWIWDQQIIDWIKSLLLFFDGIALAIPTENAERLIESDPVLAQPLAELGLLRNYYPELVKKMRESFAQWPEAEIQLMSDLASLDAEPPSVGDFLYEWSRRFARAEREFADVPRREDLRARSTLSWALLQYITVANIQPVIDNERAAAYVAAMLDSPDQSRARIMIGDLQHIGVDLSTVPLDEVLDFRRQHGPEYRTYSTNVRRFVLDVSLLPEGDRSSALTDRRAELDDRAQELRRIGRTAFKRNAVSLGFGVAGAAWTLVHGDPWAATFAAGAAAAGISASAPGPIGAAYTYILRAKAELTH